MTKNIDHEIEGVEFAAKDPQSWAEVSRKSSAATDFALAGFTFAVRWARLMQARMRNGKPLHVIAEQAYQDADYEGVSGMMAKVVEHFLVAHWAHGDALHTLVSVRDLCAYGATAGTIEKVCADENLYLAVSGLARSHRRLTEAHYISVGKAKELEEQRARRCALFGCIAAFFTKKKEPTNDQ